MESDERFKHLASDPRFKTLRRKQRKVQIDDRFKSMFTDDKFTLKYTKDKRGNTNKKTSGDDLKRYYSLEKEEEEEEQDKNGRKRQTKAKGKQPDCHDDAQSDDQSDIEDEEEEEEGDEKEDEIAEEVEVEDEDEDEDDENQSDEEAQVEETSESELSSSSDESESEVSDDDEDDDGNKVDVNRIEYNWQPLDADAETAETTTNRLAIQNLDWDHLDVKDIYTLVHSIRPPIRVRIYVSEFGKERLKDEELHGPKEIVEMPKVDEVEEEYNMLKKKMDTFKKSKDPKGYTVNNYQDADEEMDPKNEEIRERIRRYQLNRMKYYYAVAEFDSIESAEEVYKELDGMEYEGSSLELDLRFIPDDIQFDDADLKSECDKVPDLSSYEAPQFINSAVQQTTVKFTWDETDIKRQANLHKAYTKHELEKDDLNAYLGSDSESEEEEENEEEERNKYKMLLESLDAEEAKKKKVDVDVEWTADDEDDDQQESEDEASDVDDEESNSDEKESEKDENELELLVMDPEEKNVEDFEFNPDDERFKAVYESGAYNIDPSHPNFKRTEAFDKIAERKRVKRQKTRQARS